MLDPTSVSNKKIRTPLAHGDILIVDDLCDNIDILQRQLTRHEFNIDYVRNGEAALNYISSRRPDLVLLDWMMPGMSGLEVLERIRASYSPSHLPVIMVTALSEVNCTVKAFELGANDYITKPFDAKVVCARVKSQIERLQAIRTLESLMLDANRLASLEAENAFGQAALVRDAIAARKSAEEALRGALKKAEAASRAKKAFLSNMSHELRTPLNAIIGLSAVLCNETTGEHKELITHVNKSGEHLLSILNALLRMSELEHNHPALQRVQINAIELVRGAMDVLRYEAKENKIELRLAPAVADKELFADEIALKQALINIMSNAVKFSPEGGVVKVAIEQRSVDRLAFVVTDSGIGISEDKIEKMGEPFERGDFDYEGCYDGVGLGLAIARRFVEAHGGRILFENRQTQGAKVTLLIPQNTVNFVHK